MNIVRSTALLAAVIAACVVAGCGPKRPQLPAIAGHTVVALLPDPGTGVVGRAIVQAPGGNVELSAARASTSVVLNAAPEAVRELSEAEVTRLFGAALAAMPRPPVQFLLYFRFESDALTDESEALFPRVVDAIRQYSNPDISVIGHTDSAGTGQGNFTLGLQRATTIGRRLTGIGIDPALIEVTSHGEADPLVKTADEVLEPRNRRVEVTVR